MWACISLEGAERRILISIIAMTVWTEMIVLLLSCLLYCGSSLSLWIAHWLTQQKRFLATPLESTVHCPISWVPLIICFAISMKAALKDLCRLWYCSAILKLTANCMQGKRRVSLPSRMIFCDKRVDVVSGFQLTRGGGGDADLSFHLWVNCRRCGAVERLWPGRFH